jgi:hypothetical protein
MTDIDLEPHYKEYDRQIKNWRKHEKALLIDAIGWYMHDLNIEEKLWCEQVAKLRDTWGTRNARRNYAKGQKNNSSLDKHILGVVGEYVVHRMLGLDPDRMLDRYRRDNNDVGEKLEVKSTSYIDKRILCVNQSQLKDDRQYMLVFAGLYPIRIAVMGWKWGFDIRSAAQLSQPSWRHGEPYYWIDESKLERLSLLLPGLEGHGTEITWSMDMRPNTKDKERWQLNLNQNLKQSLAK